MTKLREFIAKQKEIVGRCSSSRWYAGVVAFSKQTTVLSSSRNIHKVDLIATTNNLDDNRFIIEARNNYEAVLTALEKATEGLEQFASDETDCIITLDVDRAKQIVKQKCQAHLTEIERVLKGESDE